MSVINLSSGGIYILSAPYSTGKSTLISRSKLPEGCVVSVEGVRRMVLGSVPDLDGVERLFEHAEGIVAEIITKMVEARAAQRLTTIVDATNLNDEVRGSFQRIAEKYGASFKVLILDVKEEVALERNKMRPVPVFENRLKESFVRFKLESHFPYEVISDDATLAISVNSLASTKVDVIGDVHGLYDELIALLSQAGWHLDDEGIPRHADRERTLLFLGDLVDRGQQSLKVLRLVKKAVDAGVAECVAGNHEAKIIRFWDMVSFKGVSHWSSYASAETGVALLKEDRNEVEELMKFLRGLPHYAVHEAEKLAFIHADVSRFDPLLSPKGDCLYGHSRNGQVEADELYQERYDAGINEYTLFRGHRIQLAPHANVFSLERDQAYKGELVLLQLDKFVEQRKAVGNSQAFANSVLTQACSFDFEEYSAKFNLVRSMDALVSGRQLLRNEETRFGLKGYRQHKRVPNPKLISEHPYAAKACGLVLDVAGNIVTHPFDHVPLFSEYEGEVDDDMEVIAAEKLNGFALNISKHPFLPGQLLLTSQGNFSCDYLVKAEQYLSVKARSFIAKFLANRDVTLMFEVLHPTEQRIVEYSRVQYGLYLVGVRSNKEDAAPWTEAEVDSVATEIGGGRPRWTRTTIRQLREHQKVNRGEGYMVRAYSNEEEYLFKWKSAYYEVTKYLGRMSNEDIEKLYERPESSIRVVGEVHRPVVKGLLEKFAKSDFLAVRNRVRAVQEVYNAVVV